MQDAPNILNALAMKKILGFLTFYRFFFLIPTLILTLCACFLYYQNSKYGITSSIVILKLITTGLICYACYGRKELYFYFNLGLSFSTLIICAVITDLLIFQLSVYLTKILL